MWWITLIHFWMRNQPYIPGTNPRLWCSIPVCILLIMVGWITATLLIAFLESTYREMETLKVFFCLSHREVLWILSVSNTLLSSCPTSVKCHPVLPVDHAKYFGVILDVSTSLTNHSVFQEIRPVLPSKYSSVLSPFPLSPGLSPLMVFVTTILYLEYCFVLCNLCTLLPSVECWHST